MLRCLGNLTGPQPRRALFLTPKLPYPPEDGARIAAWNLARAIRHAGFELDLACFVGSPELLARHESALGEVFSSVATAVRDVSRQYPVDLLRALLTGSSYFVRKFHSRRLERRLAELLARNSYQLTLVDSVFTAVYLPTLRRLRSAGRVVLRLQNVEHEIFERLASGERRPLQRFLLRREARDFKRFEMEAIRSVADVRAISRRDAEILSAASGSPVGVLEAQIDADLYRPGDPSEVEEQSIVSIGDYAWLPNRNGALWFHQRVWPAVAERFGNARWYIVGRNPPAEIRRLASDRVVVTGWVEDDTAYFRRAHLFAVPLLEGSGVRIKILLALAMGKRVLSTAIGAEGVAYDGLSIRDAPQDWIREIERAFAAPPSIDVEAIAYARGRHHWRVPFELEPSGR